MLKLVTVIKNNIHACNHINILATVASILLLYFDPLIYGFFSEVNAVGRTKVSSQVVAPTKDIVTITT